MWQVQVFGNKEQNHNEIKQWDYMGECLLLFSPDILSSHPLYFSIVYQNKTIICHVD